MTTMMLECLEWGEEKHGELDPGCLTQTLAQVSSSLPKLQTVPVLLSRLFCKSSGLLAEKLPVAHAGSM